MTLGKISRILAAHSVPYEIRGSRIYADSMIGGTGIWLGY